MRTSISQQRPDSPGRHQALTTQAHGHQTALEGLMSDGVDLAAKKLGQFVERVGNSLRSGLGAVAVVHDALLEAVVAIVAGTSNPALVNQAAGIRLREPMLNAGILPAATCWATADFVMPRASDTCC
ncbi:hypothetical protein B5P43_15750 [Bacillus sp. SRB_336]|nr:hypothetical protein B5P43_15750 [Bacillus sp. SRB_336]